MYLKCYDLKIFFIKNNNQSLSYRHRKQQKTNFLPPKKNKKSEKREFPVFFHNPVYHVDVACYLCK